MKKVIIITTTIIIVLLLAVLTIFVVSNNNSKNGKELSKVGKELAEIETILGQTANDYLNTDITNDEAKEKLDVLSARIDSLENEASDKGEYNELTEEQRCSMLSVDIEMFNWDLVELANPYTSDSSSQDNINEIREIRDKYYK